MDHNVIHVPAERDAGVFPVHPRIEGIVGSPRGISPQGSHGTERDSLPSLRSSHPLHFGSDLLTRLLPGQRLVARAKQITDEPAPSLRFHYRSFSATTSRSASVSASVLNASQFLLLDALPLATHHPFRVADRRIGTRLPTFRVAAADQTRATFTPDTVWPVSGSSARLIPKLYTHPGFDAIFYFSMLQQWFAHARLSDPCLTTLTPPFPQSLTTPVFSQCSTRRLDISLRRATPKGHKTFIYYTALLHKGRPTLQPPCRIRGTHACTGSPKPAKLLTPAGFRGPVFARSRQRAATVLTATASRTAQPTGPCSVPPPP